MFSHNFSEIHIKLAFALTLLFGLIAIIFKPINDMTIYTFIMTAHSCLICDPWSKTILSKTTSSDDHFG